MRTALPSGEQIEIRGGSHRVVIVEVGAGIRSYTVGDRDVLDGYDERELATAGRGQVLIPWPNRLEAGSYDFGGATHQLPLTEPEAHNAIHGLVRWVPWAVVERDEDRVVLGYSLYPQPGYPFSVELRIEYAVSDTGLRVTTSATNVGPRACPYGSGAHPYLTLGTPSVDTLVLHAPGRTVFH